LAIAISGDWCRIRIESGYHGGIAPTKDYIYPQRKGYRRKCGGWRGGGVNLASSTAGQQRLRLWVPQEINPLWGPIVTGPEQDCCDGCKIDLHPQSINSRSIAACFAPVYLFISFPDEFYQFNCR